jgi:hypothetical protein
MRSTTIALILALAVSVPPTFAANDVPKFSAYPAVPYKGARKMPDLERGGLWHSAELAAKATGRPNFAGRFEFVQVSAGTGCRSAGVIDLSNGSVIELPFAACFWKDTDQPFYIRGDSRLLVVAGHVGEGGVDGAHFYEFDGKQFKYILTRARDGRIVQADDSPSYDGNALASRPEMNVESEETQVSFDAVVGTTKLLECYSDGVERELSNLSTTAAELSKSQPISFDNAFKALFLEAGGYLRIGKLVQDDCDRGFTTEFKGGVPTSVTAVAGTQFRRVIVAMDEDFGSTCLSGIGNDALAEAIRKSCSAMTRSKVSQR